jgi:hypothetical protein
LKIIWMENVRFALSQSYPVNIEGAGPAVASACSNPATAAAKNLVS